MAVCFGRAKDCAVGTVLSVCHALDPDAIDPGQTREATRFTCLSTPVDRSADIAWVELNLITFLLAVGERDSSTSAVHVHRLARRPGSASRTSSAGIQSTRLEPFSHVTRLSYHVFAPVQNGRCSNSDRFEFEARKFKNALQLESAACSGRTDTKPNQESNPLILTTRSSLSRPP